MRACDICGKRTRVGNTVSKRGRAKHLGGVGTKITGITRRKFRPNVQRVRVDVNGASKRMKVCTACLRSGRVQRPRVRVQAKPAS